MPDVIVVGGGIIGAACAYELAVRGISVCLLERDELAAGASGRNAGLWATPADPALAPMARASLASYLAFADTTPLPVAVTRDPIGIVSVTTPEDEAAISSQMRIVEELGVEVEHLDPKRLAALEPNLRPGLSGGWHVRDGHTLDPAVLTVALALRAKELGADVRHHLRVRSLLGLGDRVTGVVTDDGVLAAGHVVVAAGPWSPQLLRTIEVDLPVTGARGWLVRLAPEHPPITRWVEAHARSMLRGEVPIVDAASYAERISPPDVGVMLQPLSDGNLLAGASRQPVVANEPDDAAAPRLIVRGAIDLVPVLGQARVVSAWWGVRPMSPDERPLVGAVRDGLIVATGHGSEGVILGGGTGHLVASIVEDDEAPFDAAPFDPHRFDRFDRLA
jgi:D-hydroxyproline dehydrogenase subunit beta